MDFRTLSDEELRTFLRAGTACFDNKKLAEREAITRFVRYHGPSNEEAADESYEAGYKAGKEEGYSRGYDAGEADALENA
jgi:flagellar biosynthesis/type III secretory pathway protein FliH